MYDKHNIHGVWASRWVFIFAATGSAVGLGNIWKFPYITGENGGGAFVFIYLLCVLMIGLPIMISEVLIGRRTRKAPMNAMNELAIESGATPHWRWVGGAGALAGFMILSFYSVIAGIAGAYTVRTASGLFVNGDQDSVMAIYYNLTHNPEALMNWHTLFMVITTVVVARGVSKGFESVIRVLMPLLFILLLVLIGFASSTEGFQQGVDYLFSWNGEALKPSSIVVAMGHAFFTLSLGMGAIMAYGSYMPKHAHIGRTVLTVAVMDTIVALGAGLVIFPIVFSYGMDPDSGPGLMFQTLPFAFGLIPGGEFFGFLFFFLITLAALTSGISLIEPMVAWAIESKGWSRPYAATVIGACCWVLGLGTVFSFNIWESWTVFDLDFFGLIDFLTANILLPLCGFSIAVFASWVIPQKTLKDELQLDKEWVYKAWLLVTRFVAPVAVILIFLSVTGIVTF